MCIKQRNKNLLRPLNSAFTLMELLIVLALLALIIGLVVTNVEKLFGGSNEKVAKLWVKNIKTPLTAYRIDVRNYPTSEEGLQALLEAPQGKESRWKGPYIEEKPVDPWGNLYQYRYPGLKNPDKYDVWSLGPDGVESEDDIGNWE